jgi:uncharacterized protein (DUF111 family)
MKVLFLDCASGISGDMAVGALVDLGVKPSTLEWELSKLALGDFHMHFERDKRKGVEGIKFGIHEGATHTHEQDEHGHHEHDHEHTHGEHEHGSDCGHEHHEHGEHAHSHSHGHEGHSHIHEHEHEEHSHSHEGHTHTHEHTHDEHEHGPDCGHEHHHEHEHGRSHRDIRGMIEHSELSATVKQRALAIFRRIAEAEGKIHGQSVDDVHFHEVGALDSIADIVCTCVAIEALGVEKVFVSALHEGHGWIDCAHGRFPVPAPATLEILKGIPLGQIDEPHEMITPTGAAIAAEFAAGFGLMPTMSIEKIGYGLGSRDLATRPNVLRAVLGELA